VGEAVNEFQAIDVINDLQPDIVLLDISISEMNGIQPITAIRQKSPKTKALMLGIITDEATVFTSLMLGARGYLSKKSTPSELIKAIKAVNRGEMWVERKLISKIFDEDAGIIFRGEERAKKTKEGLTVREQEILRALSKGFTNKEIGESLFISDKTVKTHLNNIFRKLNVTRRLQAILYAISQGMG
jgi:DNA-binding NarL/FixJ family response regulator